MDTVGDGNRLGLDMQPMMMDHKLQLDGSYSHDGSQMTGIPAGSMYPDDSTLAAGEDSNDAKRRRIARVRTRYPF